MFTAMLSSCVQLDGHLVFSRRQPTNDGFESTLRFSACELAHSLACESSRHGSVLGTKITSIRHEQVNTIVLSMRLTEREDSHYLQVAVREQCLRDSGTFYKHDEHGALCGIFFSTGLMRHLASQFG